MEGIRATVGHWSEVSILMLSTGLQDLVPAWIHLYGLCKPAEDIIPD